MAISCTECSAQLAPGVEFCPECGSEVGHYDLSRLTDERLGSDRLGTRGVAPQTSSGGPVIVYLVCALLLLAVTAFVVKSHRHHRVGSQDSSQSQTVAITVSRLSSEYNADSVQADEDYRGKTLTVTGTFYEAHPSKFDPTLTSVHLSEDAGKTFVQCVFAPQDSAPLAALHPGQQVTIRGLNIGRGNSQHPVLRGCQLQ